MDTHTTTVGDFLTDPDVLSYHDPLTDDELDLLSMMAAGTDPARPLGDLIATVKDAIAEGR